MASILKVDELQGITAAGDITVTSEGGAATMQLQQALCKHWNNVDQTGFTLADSFNTSSVTDNGTGDTNPNFTNNMNNDDYAVSLSCGDSGARYFGDIVLRSAVTTSTYRSYWSNGTSPNDMDVATSTVHGDLA